MRSLAVLTLALAALGCRSGPGTAGPGGPPAGLTYVGSSTVGTFVAAADVLYPGADFSLDTAPESDGGEAAILESACDLAGIAREPSAALDGSGVRVTLIGRDAIAVIVHPDVGVDDLARADLARLFRGEVASWSELGGADQPVRPFVVGAASATRGVLRRELLDGGDVAGCEEVQPDAALVRRVAGTPGGVGAISFGFLTDASGVTALAVDGERPSVTNFAYPLARPLHLLWRGGDPAVAAFVGWAISEDGQAVVMRRFVGLGVRGSVDAAGPEDSLGWLVVTTPTCEVEDGGVLYYPHDPYEVLTRHGEPLRRVRNHRGPNDEQPTRIALAPGVYLIRASTPEHGQVEFFATVRAGRTTDLDVLERLEDR
ncbi:MAG: substrate-binding domain-containing protein [Planctomycetota bacterium]|nr:substrate-binding domain-containing protein [Planctomycetota bacterium]